MESLWDLYKRGVYSNFSLWINEQEYKLHRYVINKEKSPFIKKLLDSMITSDFELKINNKFIDKLVIEDILHMLYDEAYTLKNCKNLTIFNHKEYLKSLDFFEISDDYINFYSDNAKQLLKRIESNCIYFPIKLNDIQNILLNFNKFNDIMLCFEILNETISLTIMSQKENYIKKLKLNNLNIQNTFTENNKNDINVSFSFKDLYNRLPNHKNNFDTVLIILNETLLSVFSVNIKSQTILDTSSRVKYCDNLLFIDNNKIVDKSLIATVNNRSDQHKINNILTREELKLLKYPLKMHSLKLLNNLTYSIITYDDKLCKAEIFVF